VDPPRKIFSESTIAKPERCSSNTKLVFDERYGNFSCQIVSSDTTKDSSATSIGTVKEFQTCPSNTKLVFDERYGNFSCQIISADTTERLIPTFSYQYEVIDFFPRQRKDALNLMVSAVQASKSGNDKLAYHLYRKVATFGDASFGAMLFLSLMNEEGKGTIKNSFRALVWNTLGKEALNKFKGTLPRKEYQKLTETFFSRERKLKAGLPQPKLNELDDVLRNCIESKYFKC